jgi:hypothetical protein
MKTGCPKCVGRNKTTDEFLLELKISRCDNDNLDYSLVDYIDSKTKVKLCCVYHGIFEALPGSLLQNHGCPKCGYERVSFSRKRKHKDIINEFREIHGDRFDYSLVDYIGVDTPIKIVCSKHGIFEQTPYVHKICNGCPKCSQEETDSKGVKKIELFFNNYNISYNKEVRFEDCRHKYTLPFDFQIIVNGIGAVVEFNGIQHFKAIPHWGGEEGLKGLQHRDKIKRDYLNQNNIPFLDINYNQENEIEDMLWNFVMNLRNSNQKVA